MIIRLFFKALQHLVILLLNSDEVDKMFLKYSDLLELAKVSKEDSKRVSVFILYS